MDGVSVLSRTVHIGLLRLKISRNAPLPGVNLNNHVIQAERSPELFLVGVGRRGASTTKNRFCEDPQSPDHKPATVSIAGGACSENNGPLAWCARSAVPLDSPACLLPFSARCCNSRLAPSRFSTGKKK